MRYDEFRDSFSRALREAQLLGPMDRPVETIDLGTTARHWKVYVGIGLPQRAEPFHVSALVSFSWDPLESARSETNEADLIRELFGDDDDLPDTMPRLLRTDIELHATLMFGSRTPMPEMSTWESWSQMVDGSLSEHLPVEAPEHRGRPFLVMGWRGGVEMESKFDGGSLCLKGVSASCWQAVVPPRLVEDVDDELEGDIETQLEMLADRYRGAFEAWMDCVVELRPYIDYRGPGE